MSGDYYIARLGAAQGRSSNAPFDLHTERLGPLPLVNHLLDRLKLAEVLERHVPTRDRRNALSHAKALLVLLRSLVVEREPIYKQHETVRSFAPALYGLAPGEVGRVGDDRIGRALDQLFAADRAALLTEVVVLAARGFGLVFDRLHNDSTSIRFCGQYRTRGGGRTRGRRPPLITYGHSKDHRPDLKQLLYILTVTGEGGVPVQFRCADGNASDAASHLETWETLRAVAGRPDFLYVADSKLCNRETMDHIDRRRGRFVTVLPRARLEDREFRRWIQTHEPEWDKVWDRPHPRIRKGPRDRWYVCKAALPSQEGWPVIWVKSTLLALKQQQRRRERLAAAVEDLVELQQRLASPRSRVGKAAEIDRRVDAILRRRRVRRYLEVRRKTHDEPRYRQMRRGRPGPDTPYRRIVRRRYVLEWSVDEEAVAYDQKSDGMYPLLTNDTALRPPDVLVSHKGQPRIEKRFGQLKSVHEIAPVYLKDPGRIEALFTLYFIALLVQALLERELRRAMERRGLEQLPLYPEARECKHPTTERVLELFSLAERHVLLRNDKPIQVFPPRLTELQRQILDLLGVPERAFLE